MTKSNWELISEFKIQNYACGLRAGDSVKLLKSFEVTQGGRVSEVVPEGEVWSVLPGSRKSPSIVWLKRPSGQTHTWDDTDEIYAFFKTVEAE